MPEAMQDSDRGHGSSDRYFDLPTFELSFAIDEEETPSRITVFPEDCDEPTSSWISMDADHAVGIFDVR